MYSEFGVSGAAGFQVVSFSSSSAPALSKFKP
jgi:hypothetical protein